MTLVMLVLMYPLLVISVAAYLINATVVCMISIVILGVLAPLFVPMLLFSYTRDFFDAWVKLMISFMLQPMVAVTFIITMFSIYDAGFYGKCKYTFADVKSGDRHTKIFYIDNNWSNYALDVSNDIDDAKDCRSSLGFMLNNPVAALYDFSKDVAEEVAKPKDTTTDEYTGQFGFLGAVTNSPSLFFTSPKVLFEKIKDLILALITACFTLYLMYNFSAQLSEFAADMTEGISIGNAAIKPQTLFKAGMAALGAAGSIGKAASAMNARKALGSGAGGAEGAGDKLSTGGRSEGASDKASMAGERSQDKSQTISSHSPTGSITASTPNSKSTTSWNVDHSPPSSGNNSKPAPDKGRSSTQPSSSGGRTPPSDSSDKQSSSGGAPPRLDNATLLTAQQASRGPHVPMEKLDSTKVNDDLSSFFRDKNIDANSLKSYSSGEFSRYVAFSSDEKKSKVVREPYKAMLSQTFANESMKGHEADFVNKVESMFSGTQLEKIKEANDQVLKKKVLLENR